MADENKVSAPLGSYDVKETKEVISFLCRTGNMVSKAMADGRIGYEDTVLLGEPLLALVPAVSGITKVGAEMKDFEPHEAEEIRQHIITELALDPKQAHIEELIEQILGAAFWLAAAVVGIVRSKKSS